MTHERIAALKGQQIKLRLFADEVEPPALLLLADDDSLSIKGNEAGLVRFALEILEVSAGGQVSPTAFEWINAASLPLEGIVLDPNPTLDIKESTLLGKLGAYTVLAMILTFLTVGAVSSLSWIVSLFHR